MLDVSTPSDREIHFVRRFKASRALVWDCHTKPELVSRWLLGPAGWTMPVCEMDVRVGGGFRWIWRHEDGREMGIRGVYREVHRPERIVHTERFDEDWTGGETLVTTLFSEARGATTMNMTVLYRSKEARDNALKSGMTGGMEQSYARIDEIAASMPA
jgi:uncharacterized protein YndB with AHSA1/START domain